MLGILDRYRQGIKDRWAAGGWPEDTREAQLRTIILGEIVDAGYDDWAQMEEDLDDE